jgi:hypothetical protein
MGQLEQKNFLWKGLLCKVVPLSLAPYLYLFLVANVLNAMSVNPIHQVEGLMIRDGSILRNLFFANDTILFLNGSRENF